MLKDGDPFNDAAAYSLVQHLQRQYGKPRTIAAKENHISEDYRRAIKMLHDEDPGNDGEAKELLQSLRLKRQNGES